MQISQVWFIEMDSNFTCYLESNQSLQTNFIIFLTMFKDRTTLNRRRIGAMVDSPYKKHGEHETFVDPVDAAYDKLEFLLSNVNIQCPSIINSIEKCYY